MKREIDNHKKSDLGKLLCDNLVCSERGEYGKCYLELYKDCYVYKAHKIIIQIERNLTDRTS